MAKKTKKRQKTASKNIVIFILSILLIAAITFGIIVLVKQAQRDKSEKDSAQDRNTASSATENEEDLKDADKVAAASNDAKDRMEADEKVKADTTVEVDDAGLKIAKPVLSFVAIEGDKVAAGGAIYNINETGGKCTYSFSKDGAKLDFSTNTLPNPGYISCEAIRVDKNKFTAGTWTVKIIYKSNAAEGESETQNIRIQ